MPSRTSWRMPSEADLCSESRIQVPFAERSSERGERRLSGAMARSYRFHLPGVMQARHHFLDIGIRRSDQMHPARNQADVTVEGGRGPDNVLDARVRASDNQHDAVRRLDGERQLAKLQRPGLVGNQ